MKNSNLIILLLTLSFPIFCTAQGWEKSYSENLEEYVRASDKTLDGGIVMAGTQQSNLTDLEMPYIYQVDSDGNLIWEYYDSNHIDSSVIVSAIHATSDGNYLFVFGAGDNFDTADFLLQKITPDGIILWENTFTFSTQENFSTSIAETSNGEYILVKGISSGHGASMFKFDSDGNLIWEKEYLGVNGFINPQNVIITNDGDIVIILTLQTTTDPFFKAAAMKTDADGNLLWEQSFNTGQDFNYPEDIVELPTGEFVIGGSSSIIVTPSFSFYPSIIKIDTDGNQIWSNILAQGDSKFVRAFQKTDDGGFVLAGHTSSPLRDFFLIKVDSLGNQLWENSYGRSKSELLNGLYLAENQGFFLAGSSQDTNGNYDAYLVKTDSLGNLYSNALSGVLFNDENFDCDYNPNENHLSQWLIQATKGENHYSQITSEMGEYHFTLDTGTYQIEVSPISPYWVLCDTTFEITYTTYPDTISYDIPAQPEIDCPLLDVSIGTPFIRRCSTSTYYVQYCNYGTAVAEDAFIEITLDPDMTLNSTSIPLTNQVGNLLTFDIGDVEYDTCGMFNFEISLGDSTNCDSIVLGATHCVEAHIYPDSICLPEGMWLGASVEVEANCTGDSIIFYIQNVGTAPTQSNLQYIVVEDDVILFDGNFSLNPNETEIVTVATNGSTFRLEAEQEPFHPGMSMPSVTVENCGLPNTTFSFGFFNIFAQDDGDPYVDIDCQNNIGSYDPNDKQGIPLGYTEENYINRGQDIEYIIRFQNTGTDTAFNVVIKDQLSEFLDISSVRPGTSSHPYEYAVSGNGLMSFTFDNIMLPDSFVNEPASNGFVKFKVSQKPNLDLETQIRNSAAIYFDFNAPIFTNQTLHTIGENFVIVSIDAPLAKSLTQVKAHPNPFSQFVNFEVEGLEIRNAIFKLYDAMGRKLREQSFNNNTFTFHKKELQTGMYFFTIEEDGRLIANGKLIAQ